MNLQSTISNKPITIKKYDMNLQKLKRLNLRQPKYIFPLVIFLPLLGLIYFGMETFKGNGKTTGDDFDLKISDKSNPSYLVIANDPEKEQVIGSLNALILNRLVTRINSKGNLPVSIIVDELPTLYFHKIDRLIGTARSNKVAVTLGFQELPQLEADYGKNGMQKIITTCGNIFMGAARNKETLEWARNDVFGKAKQTSKSITINDSKVSTSISEKMDNLVPAAKIADMATGWLAGQAARDFSPTEKKSFSSINLEDSPEFRTTKL